MSGSDSFEIADKIYKGKRDKKLSDQKSHTIHYGYIMDCEDTVDEVTGDDEDTAFEGMKAFFEENL